MEGPGADFHVVGLHDYAVLPGPVRLETQDQVLEMHVFSLPAQLQLKRNIITAEVWPPLEIRAIYQVWHAPDCYNCAR